MVVVVVVVVAASSITNDGVLRQTGWVVEGVVEDVLDVLEDVAVVHVIVGGIQSAGSSARDRHTDSQLQGCRVDTKLDSRHL